jgi:hypothetical protein
VKETVNRRKYMIMMTKKRFNQYFIITVRVPSVVVGSHHALLQIHSLPKNKSIILGPFNGKEHQNYGNLIIATGLQAIPHDVEGVLEGIKSSHHSVSANKTTKEY